MPRRLNIAGQIIKVDPVKPGKPLYEGDKDSDLLGVCLFYENRIAVRILPDSQMREALLHEVLHALVRVARLHHGPIGPLSNFDKEELAVAVLATHLLDTLRRNPALAAYLLERDGRDAAPQ